MKTHLILLISMTLWGGSISEVNRHKKKANTAMANGDFKSALKSYQHIHHDLDYSTPRVALNLANCFHQLQAQNEQYADSAISYYHQVIANASDRAIISEAHTQRGIYHVKAELTPQNLKLAIENFKSALKANPTNKEARYNYELVKKLLKELEEQKKKDEEKKKKKDEEKDPNKKQEEQKEQQKKDQQQNKKEEEQKQQSEEDKDQKESQSQESKGDKKEEGESGEGKKDDEDQKAQQAKQKKQRLEQINVSPEKLKEIMETFRNKEVKFFQQMRKAPSSKQKEARDKSKPDW